jgi:HEPN domain-containing protein
VAELTLQDADLADWPAGFHLQQAAEKALKAVLVAHGSQVPRTHDLDHLVELVEELEPMLGSWGDRLLVLNEYGVVQRYPGIEDPEAERT